LLRPENFAAEYYRKLGYQVHICERRLINTLVAAFLWTVICDSDDPLSRICGIGWRGERFSKLDPSSFDERYGLLLRLPIDFGSRAYYTRRNETIEEWVDLHRRGGQLIELYDYFLEVSTGLREYLWVCNTESEELTRAALEIIPKDMVIKMIMWTIEDFWDRHHGWPDLFIYDNKEFLFVEVKSPKDRLSLDQMRWFKWAIENHIPCEICRLNKKQAQSRIAHNHVDDIV